MGLSREVREETSTSATLDAMDLDVLYCDLPSYRPEFVGDLVTVEETRAILPPMLSPEPIISPLKSVSEMMVAYTMPLVLTIAGLRVITNPASPMLIVESALSRIVNSPTSLVVGVLVLMKTPPRFPAILHPSQTSIFSHFFHCYDGEIGRGFIFGDYSLAGSN